MGCHPGNRVDGKPLADPRVVGLFGNPTKIAHIVDSGKHVYWL
jgi:hypothetical protein